MYPSSKGRGSCHKRAINQRVASLSSGPVFILDTEQLVTTRVIMAAGLPAEHIHVVEHNPETVRLMRLACRAWPRRPQFHCGDAFEVLRALTLAGAAFSLVWLDLVSATISDGQWDHLRVALAHRTPKIVALTLCLRIRSSARVPRKQRSWASREALISDTLADYALHPRLIYGYALVTGSSAPMCYLEYQYGYRGDARYRIRDSRPSVGGKGLVDVSWWGYPGEWTQESARVMASASAADLCVDIPERHRYTLRNQHDS
jgi:hypothetical protein